MTWTAVFENPTTEMGALESQVNWALRGKSLHPLTWKSLREATKALDKHGSNAEQKRNEALQDLAWEIAQANKRDAKTLRDVSSLLKGAR
jgi:hypothetical protein